ncbi:MAG: helix-turn-helix domain-containing protein, partial [Clostridia bacterium]|nr:helix-turn-helix domain-containing protein [Clostridia bacterium]
MKDNLILSARDGDESAFAELTKKYAPLLDSLTEKYFRLCDGTAEGFDDLRQEAFVAFYRAVVSFDINQDKVSF